MEGISLAAMHEKMFEKGNERDFIKIFGTIGISVSGSKDRNNGFSLQANFTFSNFSFGKLIEKFK